MPFANHRDHNAYMRRYREENRERINQQIAERKLWKKVCHDDDIRSRVSAALDVVLSSISERDLCIIHDVISRCTPAMIDELVSRRRLK